MTTKPRYLSPVDQIHAYALGKAGVVTQGGLDQQLKELRKFDRLKIPRSRVVVFDVPVQGADYTATSTTGGGTSYVTGTNWTWQAGGDQSWLVKLACRVTFTAATDPTGAPYSVRHNLVVDFNGGTAFDFCNIDDINPAAGVIPAASSLDDFATPPAATYVFSLKSYAVFPVQPGKTVSIAARAWTGTAAKTATLSLTDSVFAPRFVGTADPLWAEDT